jgi:hypothetical protein
VLVLRATKNLPQRLSPAPTLGEGERSTTMLCEWCAATTLQWRPQVALLVNQATLLPVLIPLAVLFVAVLPYSGALFAGPTST